MSALAAVSPVSASAPSVPGVAPNAEGRRWAILAALVVGAGVLRLHDLGSQLWLDEMDAVAQSIRRPLADIATRWPSTTSHVLYDLFGHACLRLLGESAFAVRLPAALFGVAGVAALYLFVERALGRRAAVVAGALLAVAYHHVFHSQNARGYSALVFFALLASYTFLGFRARPRGGISRTGYAVTCALAAYSVLFGLVLVAAHGLIAGTGAAAARLRPTRSPPLALRPFAGAAAMAVLLTALLYAPFAPDLLRFTRRQAALPAGAAGAHGGRLSRLGVAADTVEGLARGFGGKGGLAAALVVGAIGTVVWARRDGFSLAVLAAPVVLQLAALLLADVPLSPRYFALALPPLVVALAVGLVVVGDLASGGGRTAAARRGRDALVAAAVLASALPLAGYYAVPKQDFRGAIERVNARARGSDRRLAVHYAAIGVCGYYRAGFQDVQALSGLEAQERLGGRVWLITTLERFLAAEAPALYGHIQSSYRRVEVLPATVGGAEMVIYERDDETRF